MTDLPIFVDPEEDPPNEEEIRETANRILEAGEPGDGNLLAQLVLAWFDWKPAGWQEQS